MPLSRSDVVVIRPAAEAGYAVEIGGQTVACLSTAAETALWVETHLRPLDGLSAEVVDLPTGVMPEVRTERQQVWSFRSKR